MKLGKTICLLAVMAFVANPAFAAFMPLRTDAQGERPDVTLLRNDAQQVQLEIRLPGVNLFQGTLEGKLWDRVEIPGGARGYELGAPEAPHFSRLLIIPASKGVRTEFEALETTTLQDVELMPTQDRELEEIAAFPGEPIRFDMSAYSSDAFYPEQAVMVGEPAILRGLRVVALRTNPVQYNPTTKELRIATRYRVTVHFEGSDLRNVPKRQFPLSKTWAKMVSRVSFNYEEPRTDEQNMGSYLIVCENDANLVNTLLTPLKDWKRRKGHTVAVQTFTPGSSNATIKSLIQTAYNTWPIPPEYVLLFGDTGQNYALPGWSPEGIDHPYSQLDGSDILADVAIGRLPADNAAMAAMMINKVLFYEKMPWIGTTDWYHQGCLVAGSTLSGTSTIQTNRWIKNRMIEHQYTRVDTFWYNMSGSVAGTITNSVNNVGVNYVNYRGWQNMENFEMYHIEQMTNGRKMPFVTTITCNTGGFDFEESFMEHFVSVGSATSGNAAVAAVGTATASTSTRFNNAVDYGIYAGIFDEGITQCGTSLVRGKLELYTAYIVNEPWEVDNYSLWNALAGDPGLELFNGAIRFMTDNSPSTMTWGDNSLSLTVTETGVGPLEGATACAYFDSSKQVVAETDVNGQVTLPLTGFPAGNIKLTITKHNFYPIVDSLNLVQATVAVGYYSNTINDDNVGGSSGDNDGVLNPGETVEIPLVFKNYGSSTTATSVNVTATEADPYATLTDNYETFANMAPGATANSVDDFDMVVAPNCPNGSVIQLSLSTSSAQGTWDGLMNLPVISFAMTLLSAQASGSDTLLSPGETANLVLYVRNNGNKNAASLTATLASLDSYVTVNDNSASFGTINTGATGNCSSNPFGLTAAANTPSGHWADLVVTYSANMATQVDTFAIALGARGATDPQGPDSYGYYCYDNTDANYPQYMAYNWVEIDPNYGGSGGVQVSLGDYNENQDKSAVATLPFTFKFYGQNTNQITICSNGWISLEADASFTDFRNYPIPSSPGPSGMVAAFWDDLIEVNSPSGHVYTKNDAANHRFIIEWSRVKVRHSPQPQEVFEIILYDPAYNPTASGDGEILVQYNTVTNVAGPGGSHYGDNGYSTVGIESPDHQDGLQVEYWNIYSPYAATLAPGRTYLFSTDFGYAPPTTALDMTLTPISPPIQIPARGGNFSFDVSLNNNGTSSATFDVWIMQKLPSGAWQGPMLGPVNLLLGAGGNITRNRIQNVPGSAAAGTYYYTGYVGVYAYVKWDSAFFTYEKLAGDNGEPFVNNWGNWGESFEPWMIGNAASQGWGEARFAPTEFALKAAFPNPFNPTVTIPYDLPQAAHVKLAVYDIRGSLVAAPVDGMRDAGRYEAVFDGSLLASGVYICRLKAGSFIATQKMVLMK